MIATVRHIRKGLVSVALCLTAAWSSSAVACTVSGTVSTTVGPYSPAAVKAGAVPALGSLAGLSCGSSVLVLLGGNYIRATFSSQNGFVLKPASGADAITYSASADPNGTYPFTQGSTIDYMQNNLLNLLGLLGGSSAALPFYVKPSSAAIVASGTYTDVITINWNWNLCSGVYALGACVGTLDKSTGTSKITVNLTVAAQVMTMTISTTTTWDPVDGTTGPNALPGSKRRSQVLLSNPDIVPLDLNTVSVVLPTPVGLLVALDGDGASAGVPFKFTEGGTASTLTFAFTTPASGTDDVDFSSDGGGSWAYVPVAGNVASEAAVTHVRLRPKGQMAAGSSFSVSLPYAVK